MTKIGRKLNIIKILNLPIDTGTTEIDVKMQIDLKEGYCHCNVLEPIKKLIDNKQIKKDTSYESEALYVIDDRNDKYTLFNFSYMYKNDIQHECLSLIYRSILKNGHIQSWENIKIDKAEIVVPYKKINGDEINYRSIKINIEPQFKKVKLTKAEQEFLEKNYWKEYTGSTKITLNGKQTFKEAEMLTWRLSELFLLIYEDMFFYDTFNLYSDEKVYKLKSYCHSNSAKLRRDKLRTKKARCQSLYTPQKETFESFVTFREKSGIIFDVFRSTIYSQTFREDYPLRLSQTMEGLANYLGIVDTKNNDKFKTAIQLSLYCNDFIKEYLPKNSNITEFAKKITKHRNSFSHVKVKCEYLQGEENEKYAEILYTTLRVIMIKHIQNQL